MNSNLRRLNSVVPGSAKHTARAHIMQEVIEELALNEKLVQEACNGFRQIERALYFLNPLDQPAVDLTRQQLAGKARCSFYTIERALTAINNLFDQIGLRLQHWDSGGWRITDGIEETIPSAYHWPSPGGRIIEQSNEKIELAIASKIIPARDEQAERRIIKEMILKEINDPYMTQLRQDRYNEKQVKAAKREARAEEKALEKAQAQAKVVQFPSGRPVTPIELAHGYIAGFKAQGVGKDEAIRLMSECWDSDS